MQAVDQDRPAPTVAFSELCLVAAEGFGAPLGFTTRYPDINADDIEVTYSVSGTVGVVGGSSLLLLQPLLLQQSWSICCL